MADLPTTPATAQPRRHFDVRLMFAGALTLALALSACGSTSTHTSSKAAAKAASGSAPASTSGAAQSAHDRAIAGQGLLRPSDFPSGWTAGPREVESTPSQIKDEAAACLHVSPALLQEPQPNEVKSPKFKDRTTGASVANSVAIGPTEAPASAYLRALKEPQAPACLSSAFQKELTKSLGREAHKLPAGFSIGKLGFQAVSFPAEGTTSTAYRITLPVTDHGVTVASYYLDAILVQVGRAYMSMTFDGSVTPVKSSMEQELAGAAVRRLQSALGLPVGT